MSKATSSEEFLELCVACRQGDYETVDVLISRGINVNQMDEWNYSPLILASLCGHESIVRLLLERGSATCDRDTFEGQRCIYGLLTDDIRNILLGFDISKTLNLSNQPFASYISSLLKDLHKTSDVMFKIESDYNVNFKLHRFLLGWRSLYFKRKLLQGNWQHKLEIIMPPRSSDAATFQFIVNYIYLVPCFNNFEQVDLKLLKKFALKLELQNLLEYVEEIEQIPIYNSILLTKCKNQIQLKIEDVARQDMYQLLQLVISHKLVSTEISTLQKYDFYSSTICPDVIVYIETGTYYPCHRAMLCKSQYFETLFNSEFHETQIYHEILSERHGGIIDRQKLTLKPSEIPLVSLTSVTREELAEIILTYMYMDQVEVPAKLAIEVLQIADIMFIERLKTILLISLTKCDLDNEDGFTIYDVLRVGWQTRMHRLETYAARVFAEQLDLYINTEQFEEIVIESAERIELRQETDSIELIDDIRFYLLKKYAIDLNDEEDDYDIIDTMEYERDLDKIDQLLEKLQLEA